MSNTSRQRYAANSFAVHPVTLPLYRLCRQAGEVLRTMYVRNLSQALPVQLKEDASPVTRADQRSNAILLQGLDRLGAGTPVLSEESLLPPFEQRRHWQRYWLVDPLDGTREFIEGTGHFCINIALVEGHRPVLGAIYLPLTGQMYLGGVEQSPMVYTPQSQRLLVPSPAQRAGSIKVLTSRRGGRDPRVREFRRMLESRFAPVLSETRGSAWKFCRLAEGGGHIYPRFGATSEWDTAAGQALLEAAGGRVVDMEGRPLQCNRGASLQNPPFMALSAAQFSWAEVLF